MKKIIKVVLAALMLVSCTKDLDSPTGFSFSPSRKGLIAAVTTNFSATIKIYSDNGRSQFVLDSINVRIGVTVKDTLNPINEYVNNDLAFVRNGQEWYTVGLTSIIDSLPFIIKNPTLSYYTMQISTINIPSGLYLYDGAGVVISENDITPTYTPLSAGTTKYSFSAQKEFGVDLSKRFALVYKS